MGWLGPTPDKNISLYPKGYIDGFVLSNNGTDPTNDIDISDGVCVSENNFVGINLDGSLTKQIDVNWAEGNNAGGFPSGLTLTSDTWYHVFVIKDNTNNKVDVGFDTSLTATNLLSDASGYTEYRRIGSVLYETSAIKLFTQIGNDFIWESPVLDRNAGASTSRLNVSLTVPDGLSVISKITVFPRLDSENVIERFGLYLNPNSPDLAPTSSLFNAYILSGASAATGATRHSNGQHLEILTDTNQTITERWNASLAGNLKIITKGWIDKRGRR